MTIQRLFHIAVLLVGASLFGCVAPAMPPHMSFSRHLGPFENEAEEAQTARIGMTTGAVIMSQPEEGSLLALFPSEGFLAYFGEHYSGSFAAGHFLGSYEGSLLLKNADKVRVGLLHGLGLGYQRNMPEQNDASSVLFYDVSGGLMIEVQPGENGKGFVAFRYTYANVKQWPAGDEFRQTDYLTFGAGAHLQFGRLEVTPELVYSRGTWQVTDFGRQTGGQAQVGKHLNYIIPMITFSASF